MPALPPDRPQPPDRPPGLPPAPGEPAAGEPEGTGTADGGCPHPSARPRSPAGPRPLPDPEAVRLCLIPDSAPPYDAEVTAPGPPGAFPRLSTGPGGLGGARGAPRPSGPDSPA